MSMARVTSVVAAQLLAAARRAAEHAEAVALELAAHDGAKPSTLELA